MTTMIQSPIKAATAGRVRRRTIGQLPARSEHIDFKTPCRKCGNAPTWMVIRGPILVERTCHTCGDVEFFDGEADADHTVADHRADVYPPRTTPTKKAANWLGKPTNGYRKVATSDTNAVTEPFEGQAAA